MAISRANAAGAEEASEGAKSVIAALAESRQLIVVKTAGWSSPAGAMELFERESGGDWKKRVGPLPVVTGRNGLRWGLGLQGGATNKAVPKREGDDCAPAGVYELGEVFGAATPKAADFLKMPYVVITPDLEGVDDPSSRYYNRLVRRSQVREPDWGSSERMFGSKDGAYRWGVVVRHNWGQRPGAGSCVFLHVWLGPAKGTSGCTAFSPETMDGLLHWLDRKAHPLLVQLPGEEYAARREKWGLP